MRDSRRYATTDGLPPEVDGPTPTETKLEDGQAASHWILTEKERSKGFIRPVRTSYRHVGKRPTYATRELTSEQQDRFAGAGYGYVLYEEYPSDSHIVGVYWTKERLNSGCNHTTTMPLSIAETYAVEPDFYGSNFCAHCREYFPVDEFVWINDDGSETDRLGS